MNYPRKSRDLMIVIMKEWGWGVKDIFIENKELWGYYMDYQE